MLESEYSNKDQLKSKIRELSILHDHKLDWNVIDGADIWVLEQLLCLFDKVYYQQQ